MESIVQSVVLKYLKEFVNNFRKEQITVNFLRGQGTVHDLDINVGAINDALERHRPRERLAVFVEVSEAREIFLGEEATDFPRRVKIAMPEPDFITVRQEDKGVAH
jgi:hypothetical protein